MGARPVTGRPPRLVAAGMATVDNIYWLPRHPGEDTENPVLGYVAAVGAPAGRGAITAARLGLDTVLVATRGDDVFGAVLDDLTSVEPLRRRFEVVPGRSQQSCVLVSEDTGRRTTVWVPQPRAGEVTAAALRDEVARASVVLVDITDEVVLRTATATAREHGVPVVLDTGDYPLPDPEVLRGVDHVLAPDTFARRMGAGEDPRDWAARLREEYAIGVVAVTEGDRGGLWVDANGVGRWAAVPVTVRDACGAGDSFHGAFAWAVAHGMTTARAFDVAAWVAARHISAPGNDPLPVAQDLLDAGVVSAEELGGEQ